MEDTKTSTESAHLAHVGLDSVLCGLDVAQDREQRGQVIVLLLARLRPRLRVRVRQRLQGENQDSAEKKIVQA